MAMPFVAIGREEPPAGSREVEAEIVEIIDDAYQDGIRSIEFYADGEDGQRYRVNTLNSFTEGMQFNLEPGDRVILSPAYLADVVRTGALVWIALFFAIITIAVGLRRGVFALVGFAATIGILFWFVFPRILGGADPVFTTAAAAILILAINLSLSHGLTRNTAVAFGGTAFGVVLAWVLSAAFVAFAKLSGLSSEEATFLYWQFGGLASPAGLLLAGIILGAVGVLDDIAITQCETVAELKAANPRFTRRELFVRAMRVGRHHIASTVNTLVLAYVGSALPLFLIFLADHNVSLWRFLNTEAVAEEVVRTLAGTSALVLTVPLTTFLAAMVWSNAKARDVHEFRDGEHKA
ncbi:YibE/F family protein [Candidatus Uhrbacteria bacterium]|nr:YibE/F family protein [Candidatus Uhrbacteria bacterium]